MMTAPVVKFQMFLRELFQFDCADLDFGISCSVSNTSSHYIDFEAVIPTKLVPVRFKPGAGIQSGPLDTGFRRYDELAASH